MKNSQLEIEPGVVTIFTGPVGSGKTYEIIKSLNKEKIRKAYIGDLAQSPMLVDGQDAKYSLYSPRICGNKDVLLNYIKEVKHKLYKFIVFDDVPHLENDFEVQNSIIYAIKEHLKNNNTKIIFISERAASLNWLTSSLPDETFRYLIWKGWDRTTTVRW